MNTLIAYPHFITGQLLRSGDLNRIVDYLNEQDRLTRRMLIGVGIFCGLDVRLEGDKIVIGKGAGVTSKGHLISFPEEVGYKNFLEAAIDKKEHLGLNDTGSIAAYELMDGDSEGKGITEGFLNDKCLVLAYQSDEISVQAGECHNTFVETNKEKQIKIRTFLVNQADIEQLPSTQAFEYIDFASLSLPFVRRPYLDEVSDAASMGQAFYDVCQNAIGEIHTSLNELWKILEKHLCIENHFEGFQAQMNEKLQTVLNDFLERLPLFYNFLKDLAAAYEELASIRVPLATCVDENWFPNFLTLGKANGKHCECRTALCCAQGCHDESKLALEKIKFLYCRLEEMVAHADFTSLEQTIKITPSKVVNVPLSDRAIPFYYQNNSMREFWNFELKSLSKTKAIPSFYPPDNVVAPCDFPFRYDLDAWVFFRVEGQLGQSLIPALQSIENRRKEENIAFDIVCVPINDKIYNPKLPPCYPDLQYAFHQELIEWIDELKMRQLEEGEDDLLAQLEQFDSITCISEGHILALEKLLPSGKHCRLEFFRHLVSLAEERAAPVPFAEFAAKHPGLEHQGGVPTGGTLVLVYHEETIEMDGGLSPMRPKITVIADFCLPYLCCEKPLLPYPKQIFMCVQPQQICANRSPVPLFTWPEGGRVSATIGDQYFSNLTGIDLSTGRWFFYPDRIPRDLFTQGDKLDVKLTFLNLGKKKVAIVEVKRLEVNFEVTPKIGDGSINFSFADIQPNGEGEYYWTVTLLGSDKEELDKVEQERNDDFNFGWDVAYHRTFPTYAIIHLKVLKEDCFGWEEKLIELPSPPETPEPNDPNDDPGDGGAPTPRKTNPKSASRAKKGNPPDDKDKGGEPISDSIQQTGTKDVLQERSEQYQYRLELLGENPDVAGSTGYQLSSMFLSLPPCHATPQRFQEIANSIFAMDFTEDVLRQAQAFQLLEVLVHSYLDKQFVLGQKHFSDANLQIINDLRGHQADTVSIINRWHEEELMVAQASKVKRDVLQVELQVWDLI